MDGGLTPGTVIDSRYRIDREIGSGGFSTVYAGFHLTLSAPVAIKVLRLPAAMAHAQRAELFSNFVEEAKVVMRMRHDNVVRTLDQGAFVPAGSSAPVPYVVLEWCGDQSLEHLLLGRAGRGLPVWTAWPLIEAIVAGLAHAHELGVAHRDLKPSNVMLARGPRGELVPRIIDFGIAKLLEAPVLGDGSLAPTVSPTRYTPAYAAPEQVAKVQTGPWTDVHAVGLLFVALVTGKMPYGSAGFGPLDPRRPTPASHGVDVGTFEAVIARALSLDPRHQQRDARELLTELCAAARELTVSADTIPAGSVLPRTLHMTDAQHPTGMPIAHTVQTPAARGAGRGVWMAAIVLSLLLVGGAALGVWQGLSAARQPRPQMLEALPVPSKPVRAAPSTLSELTARELERRVEAAGADVIGRAEEPTMSFVRFRAHGMHGIAYLNRTPSHGEMPRDTWALAALAIVKKWIDQDRAHGQELVYGVQGDRVLSVAGTQAGPTRRVFQELARGFTFEARGSSFEGPNPAMNAADARALWRAKSLSEVSLGELASRLATRGATVTIMDIAATKWSLSFTHGSSEGQLHVFDRGDRAAEQLLGALAAARVPFAQARGKSRHAVVEGQGGIGTRPFLDGVLDGLARD